MEADCLVCRFAQKSSVFLSRELERSSLCGPGAQHRGSSPPTWSGEAVGTAPARDVEAAVSRSCLPPASWVQILPPLGVVWGCLGPLAWAAALDLVVGALTGPLGHSIVWSAFLKSFQVPLWSRGQPGWAWAPPRLWARVVFTRHCLILHSGCEVDLVLKGILGLRSKVILSTSGSRDGGPGSSWFPLTAMVFLLGSQAARMVVTAWGSHQADFG